MKELGSKKYQQKNNQYKGLKDRISNFDEFVIELSLEERKQQASRCYDCGIDFCVTHRGCPMKRPISDFNDLISQGEFEKAFMLMEDAGGFSEITGRVCPAPCEMACTLNVKKETVTIRENELSLSNMALEKGWLKARKIEHRKDKKIAIVGSGPCGLMAASQLNRKGYSVDVYEKSDKIGGLLAYGIPTMKLDRKILQKRIDIIKEEGVNFHTSIEVGKDISFKELEKKYDIVLLSYGALKPKNIPAIKQVGGSVHYALDFLTASQRSLMDGTKIDANFDAKGKKVLVIGSGDTAEDCIATAIRQSSKEVFVLSRGTKKENDVWPKQRTQRQKSYGLEDLLELHGQEHILYGEVQKLEQTDASVHVKIVNKEGNERNETFDMVIVALGFQQTFDFKDSFNKSKVFLAGDALNGPSLVVKALADGIKVSKDIDDYLSSK